METRTPTAAQNPGALSILLQKNNIVTAPNVLAENMKTLMEAEHPQVSKSRAGEIIKARLDSYNPTISMR